MATTIPGKVRSDLRLASATHRLPEVAAVLPWVLVAVEFGLSADHAHHMVLSAAVSI
jgi:hypothetical protein